MTDRSIAKGLKARAALRGGQSQQNAALFNQNGGQSGPVPTNWAAGGSGSGGVLSQYEQWNFGVGGGGQNEGLPRNWQDFLSGSFGPLAPLQPQGVDAPKDGETRPEPRRMQYPIAWNMPMGQPGSEGLKLVSFVNLRKYADEYSVVRACIQVRKEEILGLDWDIVPTEKAARDMRENPQAHEDFQKRRQEALDWFRRPDKNYHDFSSWLSAALEDIFVVDALSLYIHPPRVKGKGLFGSNLAALEILDGTTIRPLLDIRGGTPRPPNPAFQQYLYGVPRTDMMDIILESDIDEMDEPVQQYKADQLLYLPYTRRSWTPYGFPGIERAIIPVMMGMKRQQFQLDFFTEGSIPGQFVTPGDDISTPQQIAQLQATLNAVAGDQAWKHKMIVLPRGSSIQQQKQFDLAGPFDEVIIHSIAMAYDVMPMELGVMSSASSSTSSGAASQMAKASQEIGQRKALKPMIQWLKSSIFDHILQDICGQDDMQFMWLGIEDKADEETMANNFKTLISTGVLSIDEVRGQMGMSPWGLPLTSDPVVTTATGVSSLGAIDPAIADADLDSVIADPTSIAAQPTTGAAAPTPAPATPALSTGTPGIGGRPPVGGGAPAVIQPVSGTSTPLHGNAKQQKAVAKAAFNDLDSLRRMLKRGKSIDRWKSEFVPAEAVAAMKKIANEGANIDRIIATGRSVTKSADRIARRSEAMLFYSSHVRGLLNDLLNSMDNPKVGMIGFIDGGTKALALGYHAIMLSAVDDAKALYPNASSLPQQAVAYIAQQRAEKQRGFLMGLAQDARGEATSQAQIQRRFNLYARSLQPAYEQGFGLSVLSKPSSSSIADSPANAQDAFANMSDYYNSEDGQQSQAETDASNGLSSLESLAASFGAGYLIGDILGLGSDGETSSQPEDSNAAGSIVWNCTSADPCDLCDERDGQEYTMATLPCWPGDGGFGEYCDGAAECKCTLDYVDANGEVVDTADNPASDIAGDFYPERADQENTLDQAAMDARAADIASVAEVSPDAAAGMAARDAEFGTPGTRYAPGGNLNRVFKSIDPEVFYQLGIGDVIADDQDTEFYSIRPDVLTVAVIKNANFETLPAGTELVVTSVSDDEVVLEIL